MNTDRILRTRTSRLLLALPAAVIAFSLAACSAPARPSVDDLSSGIQKIAGDAGTGDVFTDAIADCMAKELLDSKISDGDLDNIAAGKDAVSKDGQDLIEKELGDAVTKCASAE
ncbi:hypothetical protein ACFVAE_14250 [Microbacterium sp. NPDC057659]|uniref:hypothetical protein n=1 Tax=Microbacterium sp. NPDC057659 TaxID=3346198 RepID=UPI00366B25A7